ncbi:MAG TPA: plastocyanin/azurin family copper-binding protein [Parafilimonas sp.]|nr:plastocyanin/azurin family copper-binding protein [Parafilimonas sp.]
MKNILLFLVSLFIIETSFATIHKIKVSDFQFSPKITNAEVGDTLVFVWKSGFHTTTSQKIPNKAKPWDAPMTSSNKKYKYVITKAGIYNFNCTVHPLNMTGKIKVTNTLDAGLGELEISGEDAKAILSWKMNDNSQVSHFSVQRSTDGENFTEIARIQQSPANNNYVFRDEAPVANEYVYYQVELTDKKGNTQLSDIKMFANKQGSSKLITSISPNPINSPGHLMLQFNAGIAGKMHVQLFAQNGKLVKETDMSADKGLNNGHFHLGELTPGTYYLVCTLGDKTEKHTILYR